MIHYISSINASLFCFINSHHSVVFDYFFLIVTQLGNGWIAVPLAGFIIALVTPRKFLVRAFVYAAIAGTITGVLNTQIKRAVHSQRPLACFAAQSGAATYTVHVVGKPLRHNSFPSGHTATAFAAATILALLYGGYFYWAFSPALFIAYSRVYVGAHFPLDVLGGMAVGAGVALAVFLLFRLMNLLPSPVPARRFGAQR